MENGPRGDNGMIVHAPVVAVRPIGIESVIHLQMAEIVEDHQLKRNIVTRKDAQVKQILY